LLDDRQVRPIAGVTLPASISTLKVPRRDQLWLTIAATAPAVSRRMARPG
jgi:hypothetical protein